MHFNNEDQTFIGLEEQRTMPLLVLGRAKLDPGMASLIYGGSFFRQRTPARLDDGKGKSVWYNNIERKQIMLFGKKIDKDGSGSLHLI